MKIAVIPDIHGHLEALRVFLKAIGPARQEHNVIQLGDFIDRGPESRGCVELLMSLQTKNPGNFIVLKGNHEDLLAKSGGDWGALATWMSNGGSATLKSYGDDFERLCRGDGPQLAWMRSLPLTWEHEGLLFCHAGLSPGNQKDMDPEGMLWDRPPLSRGAFKAVICGHSPTSSGGVEHDKGVFRCDLGLGHRRPQALEYLELETGPGPLKWSVVRL